MRYLWKTLIIVLISGNITLLNASDALYSPAHISGKIIFEGENPPSQKLVKSNEDQDYCGETVASEHLLIEAGSKGIKNAVVTLTPKRTLPGVPPVPENRVNALVNFHCRFNPHVMTLKKGETLYIKNGDPVLHSNHFYRDQKSLFNLALTPSSKVLKKVMNEEGVIQVKCDIHDFMEGFVVVDPAPWILVSQEDGAFDFGEVPPGDYQFSVWHETFNKLVSDLSFKPGEKRFLPLGVKPN